MATKQKSKKMEASAKPLDLCYEVIAYRGDNKDLAERTSRRVHEMCGYNCEIRECAR